ncbi:SAM domain-containing protein SAMSN-1 [Channa argus]|uniref:SAM domain-containing protein SAMSN-1 n=1 Tax=Channa argus TaxID=215402 RepID=A0A6G1QW87_CHAAH|nr:SAM domain-containing protein SAMSN-1 [Channa argus]
MLPIAHYLNLPLQLHLTLSSCPPPSESLLPHCLSAAALQPSTCSLSSSHSRSLPAGLLSVDVKVGNTEGSTESIYEPACSQTLKDVIPKYQCSPALLRRKTEWGGSDPFISSHRETAADTAQSIQTRGRLKKLHLLMQAKKGHRSRAAKEKTPSENLLPDVLSKNNPPLTCIDLGKRTVKPCKTISSPQQLQANIHDESVEEGAWRSGVATRLWIPLECPQPCTLFYHTCHQARRELWVCGGTLSLPRTTEWDRFESLVQELDNKQCNPSPPQLIRSITDLHLSQNTNGNTHLHEAVSRLETGSEPPFTKGQRQCTDSLESLYSLKSGQSSSSGVTSGSYCYSNRGSLRLEDDLLYTRQFCGRARVHTDHVPSPYDTESLTLKVGDVIDIISKPTMGIWTGVLNGRTGNFKFIYVDVLTEESPEKCCQREYYPSLQLHGYQTVDDLMSLKEHHLMELNVTDAEHKRRLLAAVESLRQLRSDSQLENEVNQEAEVPSENMKADMNTYPRDSSCHMPSDSPDNHTDHRHQPFPSEHPLPAEMTAS